MTRTGNALVCVLLLACVAAATAQNKCDGFAPNAKIRYQWSYQTTLPDAAKALDAIVISYMTEDCPQVLAYGQGAALTTDPTKFGLAAVTDTNQVANYAGWSDWASLEDLKKCEEAGLKSGKLAAKRKYSAKTVRLVTELKPGSGNAALASACVADTNAPATVRFFYSYILKSDTPETCKKAVSQHSALAAASPWYVRTEAGCDVVADDSKFFGPTIKQTAQFGGYIDFKSLDDMIKFLTNKDPTAKAALTNLRSNAASAVRSVIALPAKTSNNPKAAVTKKP